MTINVSFDWRKTMSRAATTLFCFPSSLPPGQSSGSRPPPDLFRHETIAQFASAAPPPRPQFHRAHSEPASRDPAFADESRDRPEASTEWPPLKPPDQSATSDIARGPEP